MGVIEALNVIGLPNVRILRNNQWDWDGHPDQERWWRFWVIVELPHPFPGPWLCGDGTLSGEKLCGFDAANNDTVRDFFELVRKTVRTWQAAHAECVHVIVKHAGASSDDDDLTTMPNDGTVSYLTV